MEGYTMRKVKKKKKLNNLTVDITKLVNYETAVIIALLRPLKERLVNYYNSDIVFKGQIKKSLTFARNKALDFEKFMTEEMIITDKQVLYVKNFVQNQYINNKDDQYIDVGSKEESATVTLIYTQSKAIEEMIRTTDKIAPRYTKPAMSICRNINTFIAKIKEL